MDDFLLVLAGRLTVQLRDRDDLLAIYAGVVEPRHDVVVHARAQGA